MLAHVEKKPYLAPLKPTYAISYMRFLSIICLVLAAAACGEQRAFVLSTKNERLIVDSSRVATSTVSDSVVFYKTRVDAAMSTVIGQAPAALTKAQPESALGNFVADALHAQAEKYTGKPADLTVFNHGGLRIDALPAGDWTRGKIFELLPFDNTLIVVTMTGEQVEKMMQHIALKEGWPVSHHLRLSIAGGKADVAGARISGKPIDKSRLYRVVTNDYLANGGDNCTFFAEAKQEATGKFIRDAVIDYIDAATKNKQPLEAKVEGRVRQ